MERRERKMEVRNDEMTEKELLNTKIFVHRAEK